MKKKLTLQLQRKAVLAVSVCKQQKYAMQLPHFIRYITSKYCSYWCYHRLQDRSAATKLSASLSHSAIAVVVVSFIKQLIINCQLLYHETHIHWPTHSHLATLTTKPALFISAALIEHELVLNVPIIQIFIFTSYFSADAQKMPEYLLTPKRMRLSLATFLKVSATRESHTLFIDVYCSYIKNSPTTTEKFV